MDVIDRLVQVSHQLQRQRVAAVLYSRPRRSVEAQPVRRARASQDGDARIAQRRLHSRTFPDVHLRLVPKQAAHGERAAAIRRRGPAAPPRAVPPRTETPASCSAACTAYIFQMRAYPWYINRQLAARRPPETDTPASSSAACTAEYLQMFAHTLCHNRQLDAQTARNEAPASCRCPLCTTTCPRIYP